MAYIRLKTVGDAKYLYLVKSIWDSERRTSRQEIIKYLGNADRVTIKDMPPEYRKDPKITAFLSGAGSRATDSGQAIAKTRKNLFDSMIRGDLNGSLGIYESYVKHSTLDDFYEQVLCPALYRVGDLWSSGKLGIADEHISSNTARAIIGIITDRIQKTPSKERILLCTPSGEQHSLACQILQSSLQNRGFRVFNLAPSAPAESVLNFMDEEKPDMVMVSITISDNVGVCQRLVDRIHSKYDVPILVGGQAAKAADFESNCTVISDVSLGRISRLVRNHIAV